MLQSRLATAATAGGRRAGAIWALGKRGLCQEGGPGPSPIQGGATAQGVSPLPTRRPADPSVHSSELLGEDADAAALSATAAKRTSTEESEPLVPPKPPMFSPKLEHTEVGLPSKPNTHQKREFSDNPAQPQPKVLDGVSCAGLDGSPWPDDAEGQRAQEADNKEYFESHKASPLSELEFVDSRKPITQATSHGGAGPVVSYFGGEAGVIVWRPEQLESAEETMLKAMELWMWNKMRGDPDSPHGRILRQLRGEWW